VHAAELDCGWLYNCWNFRQGTCPLASPKLKECMRVAGSLRSAKIVAAHSAADWCWTIELTVIAWFDAVNEGWLHERTMCCAM